MSTKDHIKIRVQFDSQTKFVVPCSTEWTIQKLKEEIEQRYQKILKLQERVAITKLTLEDGSELFDEDTVGSVLENNFVVFAASQSAPQPQQAQTTQQSQLQAPAPKIQSQIPGTSLHYKLPNGVTKTLPFDLNQTVADLIVALCKSERKTNPQSYAFLYTASGLPLNSTIKERNNVSLSYLGLKDKDTICIVFVDDYTRIESHDLEQEVEEEAEVDLNQNTNEPQRQIFVRTVHGNTITIDVRDSDTVQVLKNKIWVKDKTLPKPKQQRLSYGGKILAPDSAKLHSFSIPKEATLHMFLSFQNIAAVKNWQSNFLRITTTAPSTRLGLSCFMSCLNVVMTHYQSSTSENRKKLLGHLRSLTDFPPLLSALYYLLNRKILSTSQRYAIVEGLYPLFRELVPKITPDNRVFEYSAECWTYILEETVDAHAASEEYQEISLRCPLTRERLVNPVRVQNNPALTEIYSREALVNKINNNEIQCSLQDIVPADDVAQLMNLQIGAGDEIYIWKGTFNLFSDEKKPVKLKYDWSTLQRKRNINKYTRLVSTLSLKQCSGSFPVLTLWKDGSVVVCTGQESCSHDYSFLIPLEEKEESVNLDQLATQISGLTNSNVVTNVVDERPPSEAIVVLFDVSGSMSTKENIGSDKSLRRIDIAKEFFYSFSDRVMAYAHPTHISLIFFGTKVTVQHKFTPLFENFKTSVGQAEAEGYTKLWDACGVAISNLLEFQKQHPKAKLRILCLTDGDDTFSKSHEAWTVARDAQKNKIIIDSFIIGSEKNVQLRFVSWFSGGLSFKPASLTESRRLFEEDPVVSLDERANPPQRPTVTKIVFDNSCDINKYPYDTEPPKRVPVLATKHAIPATTVLQKAAQQKPQTSKENMNRIRRLLREMQQSIENPHPAVSVFPSDENIGFWRVLLRGPPDTPYADGVFVLYAEFPDTYPTTPPICRFQTPIYHCNISRNGRICHSVFDRNYSADHSFNFLMSCVYGLLMAPEPADPLASVLAEEYHTNKAQYEHNAREYTKKYASRPYEEVKKELLGQKTVEKNDDEPPPHLVCPITLDLFKDPVMTTWNGRTYERSAIVAHIRAKGRDPVDPNRVLTEADLAPNLAIKEAVAAYLKDKQQLKQWWNEPDN